MATFFGGRRFRLSIVDRSRIGSRPTGTYRFQHHLGATPLNQHLGARAVHHAVIRTVLGLAIPLFGFTIGSTSGRSDRSATTGDDALPRRLDPDENTTRLKG